MQPSSKTDQAVASITAGIEATTLHSSKYSDRYKQKEKEKAAPINAKSFADFPSLKASNTVVTKPTMSWAHTVKSAMTAAAEKAALEAERQKAEAIRLKEEASRNYTVPVPAIRSYEVKGEENYEEEEEEEEEYECGTPPYY